MVKIWENKARSYKEAEKFDDLFWRSAGAQKRFEASWMMLVDWYKMKGYQGQPQLDKSVQNVIHLTKQK